MADDHIMITKALRKSLELDFGYRDIESVTTCNEIMKALKSKKFTHLILDLGLSDGNGLEILPAVRSLYPALKILVYSMQPREVYAEALRKKFGILHYISKSAPEQEMVSGMARFFENDTGAGLQDDPAYNPFSDLSVREFEVLQYLLQNRGITDIANALGLQRSTVSTLKGRIFDKTKTTNIFELKELAMVYKIFY